MRRALAIAALLGACDGSAAATDASTTRTITITSDTIPDPSPGVRLSDGATLGSGEGDVWLTETMVVMIHAAAGESICPLGTFASITDVPADASACTSPPGSYVTLGGSTQGTDQWIGQSFRIAVDASTVYRARVIADSLATTHVRIVLELVR